MSNSNKKRSVQDWPAKKLIADYTSGKLSLETEYQRDPIWTPKKKRLLVDSILEDIDIPKIYLAYFVKEKQYECIDGKQRIVSIHEFFHNKFETEDGGLYKKLKKSVQDDFLNYKFSVSILNDPASKDIVKLFHRLNIGTPLNGGELIHAMKGDMRNLIFKRIGKDGPFVGKVGMKEYRFSREIAIAQMIINSLYFRKSDNFVRARYENIREFLEKKEYINFDVLTKKKADKIFSILKKLEVLFGKEVIELKRKSAIVSVYLFYEELIEKKSGKDLDKFPKFYLQLLKEVKQQANFVKNFDKPIKKILLEKFQHNLQQASAEGYSIERRHQFLDVAFDYYLKTGKIIGDEEKYNEIYEAKGYSK